MSRLFLILLVVLQGVRTDAQAPRGNAGQGAQGQGARGQGGQGARGAGPAAQNPNSVSPVEFLIDPPTLINLGFEWFIQGDENRNATVAVSYRKKGETEWKQALPMLRLKGERVYQHRKSTSSLRTCLRAVFSILNPTRPTKRNSSCPTPTECAAKAAALLQSAQGPSRSLMMADGSFMSIRMDSRDRKSSLHLKG